MTLLRNLAAQALTSATVATIVDHSIRNRSTTNGALEGAIKTVQLGGDALRDDIVRRGSTSYDLHLAWAVRALAKSRTLLEEIDIAKVVAVRQQRKSTHDIFEAKLNAVADEMNRPTSGALSCYTHVLGDPVNYNRDVLILMGDVAKRARAISRCSLILQRPTLSWLAFNLRPLHLVLVSLALTFTIYCYRALEQTGPWSIRSHVANDASQVVAIWEAPSSGLVAKVAATTTIVYQMTSIIPLLLLSGTMPLYILRTSIVKSNTLRSKLADAESMLANTAAVLRINHPSLINIEEIKMSTKTINVENVGPGAIVNIADYMANVTNTVTQNLRDANQPTEVKALLGELTARIKDAASTADGNKIKQLGQDLETITKEMTQAEPRKKWYEMSLQGMKEAAEAIGKVGVPILEVLLKLGPLLLA